MTDRVRDIVAGIGFRHAATRDHIVALVRQALDEAGLPETRLRALATGADRAREPAFQAAAAGLDVAALGLAAPALTAVDAGVTTRSKRMEAERGIGSLAEAAALAGAGPGAVLVLARIRTAVATCALARTGRGL